VDEAALKIEEADQPVEPETPPMVEAGARPIPAVEPSLESEREDVAAADEQAIKAEVAPAPADIEIEVEKNVPAESAVLPEPTAIDLDSEADLPDEAAARPVKAESPAEVEAEGHTDPAQLSLLNPELTPVRNMVEKSE
jgi:hypothetical protein